MSLFRNFAAGIRTLFQKQDAEREMDEELRGYLRTGVAERMRSGMSRESAYEQRESRWAAWKP